MCAAVSHAIYHSYNQGIQQIDAVRELIEMHKNRMIENPGKWTAMTRRTGQYHPGNGGWIEYSDGENQGCGHHI